MRGLSHGAVRDAIVDRLERSLGKSVAGATRRDFYDALAIAVREELAERWIATRTRVAHAHVKRVCYLSMEFLLGRSLINALSSFDDGLIDEVREIVALRERLVPYLAAHARQSVKTSRPLLRPLFFDHPDDPAV